MIQKLPIGAGSHASAPVYVVKPTAHGTQLVSSASGTVSSPHRRHLARDAVSATNPTPQLRHSCEPARATWLGGHAVHSVEFFGEKCPAGQSLQPLPLELTMVPPGQGSQEVPEVNSPGAHPL